MLHIGRDISCDALRPSHSDRPGVVASAVVIDHPLPAKTCSGCAICAGR